MTNSTRPRLPALTSLRFFAALHVVFFHLRASKIAFQSGWSGTFVELGYIGVSLFFVLSGFILVYTYQGKDVPPGRFLRARFARVFPAYVFSLLVTTYGFYWTIHSSLARPTWAGAHPLVSGLSVLTLTQAWIPLSAMAWNNVAWSLSVEAFFYLVFPFALVWLGSRGKSQMFALLGLLWLVSLAVSTSYVMLKPDGLALPNSSLENAAWLNVVKFNPLVRLPEFLMGMTTGMLFLRNSANDRKLATPLVLGALFGILSIAYFSPAIPYPILHTGLFNGLFATLVYGLALGPSWTKFLNARVLVLLGDASYSLYLLHCFVLRHMLMRDHGSIVVHSSTPWVVFTVAVAIAAAVGVYKFIEEPGRRKLNPRPLTREAIADSNLLRVA
jgi:peptidoglycan/LPS O-acetylase OafA/YrhL